MILQNLYQLYSSCFSKITQLQRYFFFFFFYNALWGLSTWGIKVNSQLCIFGNLSNYVPMWTFFLNSPPSISARHPVPNARLWINLHSTTHYVIFAKDGNLFNVCFHSFSAHHPLFSSVIFDLSGLPYLFIPVWLLVLIKLSFSIENIWVWKIIWL